MLTLFLALFVPPLLYRVIKWYYGPRPHNLVRTEEDYRIMWEIACQLFDRKVKEHGRCQRRGRDWYHLVSYTVTLLLITSVEHYTTSPPQCSLVAEPTTTQSSLVTLLLGTELPICSQQVKESEYCLAGRIKTQIPAREIDFFINQHQSLHVLTPEGVVTESALLERLSLLDGNCHCPSEIGLFHLNVSFLKRWHQEQHYWIVLYEPVLRSNRSDRLMIEFSAVALQEGGDLLLERYNERLKRHNLTVLKRVHPYRERLPLRLQGSEAACFNHCLQHPSVDVVL